MFSLSSDAETLNLGLGMTRDCIDPWTYLEFRINGDIAPCCKRPGVGNLAHESLPSILNGKAIRSLRAALLRGAPDRQCAGCTMRAPVTPAELQEKVATLLQNVKLPYGFDRSSYLKANPDIATMGIDPVQHFLSAGRFEGRHIFPNDARTELTIEFDPELYLQMNLDVADIKAEPIEHFLRHGQYEGRKLRPRGLASAANIELNVEFDSELYLLMNPDVAKLRVESREHFLQHGQYEGRKLRPRVIATRQSTVCYIERGVLIVFGY